MWDLRRVTFTALLVLAVPAPDAAEAAPPGPVATGFVEKAYVGDDGKEHKYVVFIPPSYKGEKKYPCFLFLHGSGMVGTAESKRTAPACRR